MGRLRLFARLALVEAALNLALSVALVGPFGIIGVAVAVALPNILFCLFAIAYACSVLDIGIRHYLFASWLCPLAAAILPALVWCAVTPVEANWGEIGFGIGAGLAPYALFVAGIEASPHIKHRVLSSRTAIRRVLTRSAR
jgi:O-antigen/teichoic acid export membrane protein